MTDDDTDAAADAWADRIARPNIHVVEWKLEHDYVRGDIRCMTPADGWCRWECPDGCEVFPCYHQPRHVNDCTVVDWFQDSAEEYYDGPAVLPANGLISLLWTGDGYDWCYAETVTAGSSTA